MSDGTMRFTILDHSFQAHETDPGPTRLEVTGHLVGETEDYLIVERTGKIMVTQGGQKAWEFPEPTDMPFYYILRRCIIKEEELTTPSINTRPRGSVGQCPDGRWVYPRRNESPDAAMARVCGTSKPSVNTEIPKSAPVPTPDVLSTPPPTLKNGKGPTAYLVIIGQDSNFDITRFTDIMKSAYNLQVTVNAVTPDTGVAVYECGTQEPWQHEWLDIFVAGHCNLGAHESTRHLAFMDLEMDQTAEIIEEIDASESGKAGEED